MLEIIAFIVVVFIWDGLKKSMRAHKNPTISLRRISTAECGCQIVGRGVAKACAAHDAILRSSFR